MATIPLTSWQLHQATKKTRKSQLEAIKRYQSKKSRIYILVKPELKTYIDQHLKGKSESRNHFISRAIVELLKVEMQHDK